MTKQWPLDDVRNQRWNDLLGYIDELASCVDRDSLSMLLISVCGFADVSEVVDKLVSLGADCSFRPFVKWGTDKQIRFLDAEPGNTALGQAILGAAWHGRQTLPVAECLIANGADVNGITFSGYTPLQLAVVEGQLDHLALLLRNGADPYKPSADGDGLNAFDFAKGEKTALALLNPYRRH